ncbi:MAG: hypothetical protein ACRD47_09985 [Nitrososphaeraceae archaeon]
MNGYYDGLASCGGSGEASSTPSEGSGGGGGERYYEGVNWRKLCNDFDNFISEPYGDLVTPDGYALIEEGKIAVERIACGGQAILGALLTQNLMAALPGLRC